MDIQIKDENTALASCEELVQLSQTMNEDITALEAQLSKIKESWASNGIDKESYVVELDKQINNFRTICEFIRKFCGIIENYLTNAKQISSLSVGDSVSGIDMSVGYVNSGNAVAGAQPVNVNVANVSAQTSVRSFAAVGEDGNLVGRTYEPGVSIEDFASANNVSIDRVAVDVGIKDGDGLGWFPASTFE